MNILFTSVGRMSYLVEYFKEALGSDGKVHVANSSASTPAFLAADETVVTPLIYDSEYIPFLLHYCKDNKIDAIIPLFDSDLSMLSKHLEDFNKIGTQLVISDFKIIELCNDKLKANEFLNEHGFTSPLTFTSVEQARQSIAQGNITYPLIVKPRWGTSSKFVFEADNIEELLIFYKKVKRAIKNSSLKYLSADDPENDVIIQQKLKGREYGLDVINDLNGNYITTVAKKKYAMRSGETDCAITINSKPLKEIGEKLSLLLKHRANLDVDVFVDGNNFYVIDMNARFGGGYPFTHAAGVNLPKAIIEWLKGNTPDADILKEDFNCVAQKDIKIVKRDFDDWEF